MRTQQPSGTGTLLVGLLTIMFVGFKLAGIIDWSWWWVLSPLWIAPIVFFSIFLVGLLIYGAVIMVSKLGSGRR